MSNVIPPSSASVTFYAENSAPLNANYFNITQQEYHHDQVEMQFWADDATAPSYASGTPVKVEFGRPTVRRTFYGYVNHPTRTSNNLANQSLIDRNSSTVTCLGASFWMKTPSTTSWLNMSVDQIVSQIAAKHGLAANVVPHPTRWTNLQQAGATDWEFCVDLAQRVGYTFYCNGTQLYFGPRRTNPLEVGGTVFTYDFLALPSPITEFFVTLGANNPTGGKLANRQVASINPRTGSLIYSQVTGSITQPILGGAQESPLFFEYNNYVVHSQFTATVRNQGAGIYNQMYLTAKATVPGNPMICQGSLINVLNANGSQNGLWYVTKADHIIDKTNYVLHLHLGRDSVGSTQNISYLPTIANPPATSLVNNMWVAA